MSSPVSQGIQGCTSRARFWWLLLLASRIALGCHRLCAVMPQYGALVNNLSLTTDRSIMGSRVAPSSRSSSQGAKSRIAAAPLTWSVALRASQDVTIQASIEYVAWLSTLITFIYFSSQDWTEPWVYRPHGQAILKTFSPLGYWRNLGSSTDFARQTLKDCVNVIHVDIIEIWNLYDRPRVSSPHLPRCYDCSTESVFVRQPIQDENVPFHQRPRYTSWWCIAEVGVLHNK